MQRFTLQLPCLIYAGGGTRGELLCRAYTANVGAGGAFVETDQPFPRGLQLQFELLVKAGRMLKTAGRGSCISMTARVVRCNSAGMALVFGEGYRIARICRVAGLSRARLRWLQGLDVAWEKSLTAPLHDPMGHETGE